MKKILLLFAIFASILSATAQSTVGRIDNQQIKTSQLVINNLSTERIIESISVYPNPVVDELKITFRSSHRGQALVSLFNNIGKPVYSQETNVEPGSNIISIEIRSKSIDPGVYFIQLKSENQTFTRKLIVK